MGDQVKALRKAADDAVADMGVTTCKTCLHYNFYAKCDLTGYYASVERGPHGHCGFKARYWTPKPPTFWQRLGAALIERVRGK